MWCSHLYLVVQVLQSEIAITFQNLPLLAPKYQHNAPANALALYLILTTASPCICMDSAEHRTQTIGTPMTLRSHCRGYMYLWSPTDYVHIPKPAKHLNSTKVEKPKIFQAHKFLNSPSCDRWQLPESPQSNQLNQQTQILTKSSLQFPQFNGPSYIFTSNNIPKSTPNPHQ
jgi:hypothetical protein